MTVSDEVPVSDVEIGLNFSPHTPKNDLSLKFRVLRKRYGR